MTDAPTKRLIEDILSAIADVIEKAPPEVANFEGVLTHYALVLEFVGKDGEPGQQLIYNHGHPAHAVGILHWAADGVRAAVQPHRVMPMQVVGYAEEDEE